MVSFSAWNLNAEQNNLISYLKVQHALFSNQETFAAFSSPFYVHEFVCVCVYCLKSIERSKELLMLWPRFVFKLPHPQSDSLAPLTSINAFAAASKEQASAPACTQGRRIACLFPSGTQPGTFALLFHPGWSIWAACLSQAWLIPICNNWSRRALRVFHAAPLPRSLFLTNEGWISSSLGDWKKKQERWEEKVVTRWKLRKVEEIPAFEMSQLLTICESVPGTVPTFYWHESNLLSCSCSGRALRREEKTTFPSPEFKVHENRSPQ